MANFLWTQKQDIGPKPRTAHCMAFDAARNRSVLFGGTAFAAGIFNDTWEWDGKLWTQVADMGPSSRSNHAMAYNNERKGTILFGGIGSDQKLGDTWEWNGENWTQLSNSGPQPRTGHAMVYDTKRKLIILFGGETDAGVVGDTWAFNGEEWSPLDNSGPSARKFHSMAYDSIRERVILFGGVISSDSNGLNDTWEWNGTNWTQVADFGPPSCLGASMVFMNNIAVLFGGSNSLNSTPPPVLFDNTWGWDGRRWTQYQDIGPSERWGHAAIFDTQRRSQVLFGGLSAVFDPGSGTTVGKLLGDSWEHLDTSAPPGDPIGPGNNNHVVSIDFLNLVPSTTTAAEVQNVIATVLVSEPANEVGVRIRLFFKGPQEDVPEIEVGLITIEPGQIEGSANLQGGLITESGNIFAVTEVFIAGGGSGNGPGDGMVAVAPITIV